MGIYVSELMTNKAVFQTLFPYSSQPQQKYEVKSVALTTNGGLPSEAAAVLVCSS